MYQTGQLRVHQYITSGIWMAVTGHLPAHRSDISECPMGKGSLSIYQRLLSVARQNHQS